MHLETTTRLRAITLRMRGNALLLYGRHTFQALSLWHQFHFVYRPRAYQMVDDQR
jgi:hypothetical protein